MPTFIPGYLGTVTLNTDDISAIGSVVRLAKSKNVMTKPTFGNAYGNSLGGQKLAAFSASGHISSEQIAELEAMFEADDPIAFSLQIGEASSSTDAGAYTGDCVVSNFTVEANADGEWDWSIDAQTDGTVTYTEGSSGSAS